ncbi:hypothetical protein SAMN04489806_0663 [Paramicrobacterium humi]|uniref:Uncharacterized protein n=1 Tax=Paramicrobacterium humi TaxID=640635 RepID=A0A1H4JEK8_9MICO|nr:hypothetical protein [Microbacterium humi]SEB44764.1 hypothetical protein SAMN04489806_0663 [Microbacterium humi]
MAQLDPVDPLDPKKNSDLPSSQASRDGDPTKMRNQKALRTSSGRIWLIVGALLVIACLVTLLPMIALGTPVPVIASIIIVLLYAGMFVVRFVVDDRRKRLFWLAVLFCLIAVVGLIAVIIPAFAEHSPL